MKKQNVNILTTKIQCKQECVLNVAENCPLVNFTKESLASTDTDRNVKPVEQNPVKSPGNKK